MDDAMMELSDTEFEDIATLVRHSFGIHLTDKKRALVRGRLSSLLRSSSFKTFTEYLAMVRSDTTGRALSSLIDRISTNHSFFFREPAHFETLMGEVLPDREREGKKPDTLRIWSCGCAAGEEPYTLAILLHERYGDAIARRGPVILATDVSLKALQQAATGLYPSQRLEGVPDRYLRYFRKTDTDTYTIADTLRPLVLFKRLNLMRPSYPFQGTFDVVFCRNVMIYFDQPTRGAVVGRFHRYLNDGGYLFIGHSETLGRDTTPFRYVRPTVYRK